MDSSARQVIDEVRPYSSPRCQSRLPARSSQSSRSSRFSRFSIAAVALFAVWVVLSGKLGAYHLGAGALGALVIAYFHHSRDERWAFPLFRFIGFLPWFILEVVRANLHVARLVVGVRDRTSPRIVVIYVGPLGDAARALLGCAITLTPGTLTVDFRDAEIWVHALDGKSAEDVESGRMLSRVRRVFGAER